MIKRATPDRRQINFDFMEVDPAADVRERISKILKKERGYLWRLLNNAVMQGGRMGLTPEETESCRALIRNMDHMTDDELINAVEGLDIRVKLHPLLIKFERIVLLQMHEAYKLLHDVD